MQPPHTLLPPSTPQEITPEKALEILRRISEDDCRALGFDPRFSRPDFMILSVLPVPPPPVRPSVQMDSSSRWGRGGGVWGVGVCLELRELDQWCGTCLLHALLISSHPGAPSGRLACGLLPARWLVAEQQ